MKKLLLNISLMMAISISAFAASSETDCEIENIEKPNDYQLKQCLEQVKTMKWNALSQDEKDYITFQKEKEVREQRLEMQEERQRWKDEEDAKLSYGDKLKSFFK